MKTSLIVLAILITLLLSGCGTPVDYGFYDHNTKSWTGPDPIPTYKDHVSSCGSSGCPGHSASSHRCR